MELSLKGWTTPFEKERDQVGVGVFTKYERMNPSKFRRLHAMPV
jgi:hypothetical protein